jgi:putative tryptophan/tyrosine transport system substrate-binding protein
MGEKMFSLALGALLLALSVSADAQQAKKLPRIGFIAGGSPSSESPRIEALRQGLRDLGYMQGKNILFEYRYAEGETDRIPALAVELVQLKVDIIVTAGGPMTRAAKQATSTIPIVMAAAGNPVGSGLVASLARPGGNVTGLTTITRELDDKRLELLKEAVPKVTRVGVLWNPEAAALPLFKQLEVAARSLGLQLQSLEVRAPEDFDGAFRAAAKGRSQALLVLRNPVIGMTERGRIAKLANKSRLPTIYDDKAFVEAGGLMAYGTNITDLYRRVATYVDKILKGAKPADLPVEQPMKFEFVINLKTAKQIGVTIPPNVLARADRVIK